MKRITGLLLSICILALTGCGAGEQTGETTAAASAQTGVSDDKQKSLKGSEKAMRTIVDQAGNEVEIPVEINRVVISSLWPLPSVYVLYQGSGAKLVGMHPASKSAAENSLLMRIAPELKDVETGFIKGTDINLEELLKLEPDVVLCNSNNPAEYDLLRQAGIAAVGFSTSIADFNTVETVNEWVKLLGEVFQEPDKAKGITQYGREVEKELQERLKNLEAKDKPRVLMLYKYNDGSIQTSGNKFFGQYWADATGAVSVSEGLEGSGVEINMEQIYEWNPDIIYITNFSPYQPVDFYENTIEGYDWSSVKAVSEHKVFKFPLGMYRWYPPSSDSSLCLKWMAQKNHPKLFADYDLPAVIKEFYTRFYGVELTDEEIEGMFNPPREAADGV